MSLRWYTYSWNDLTKEALYTILTLRADVFVVEQECAYLDLDGKDQGAVHLVAYITNLPVAEVAAYTALALVTISNSRTRRKGQDDE